MPTNIHGMLYEIVRRLPDWGICCQNIDYHLHYAYPSEHGWRVYQTILALYPLTTLADLTTIAARAAQFETAHKEAGINNVDILLITDKEFYGTKGVALEKITTNHYQLTVLNPEHLLTFLAGIKTLSITVIGNCVVIEDALSNHSGFTEARTG